MYGPECVNEKLEKAPRQATSKARGHLKNYFREKLYNYDPNQNFLI